MKIAEICEIPLQERRKFWASLPETKSITWVEMPSEGSLLEKVKSLESQVQAFIVDQHFSDILLKEYPRISTEALKVGRFDSLFNDKGKWWPFLLCRESLQTLISERDPLLDTHSIGYIIGANTLARVAFDALSQFGFNRIKIVEVEENEAESMLAFVNTKYFGIQTQVLKSSDLTHEPNNGSALINCASVQTSADVLEELSFLNFMKKTALVVDTNVTPYTHHLMDEARHVGMKTIAGYELQGLTDWLWLKRLMPDFAIPRADYMTKWNELIRQGAN